ncbi:MAG TPA: hypothetical protein VEZ41_09415 [Allosphingosinicella sp.]|nr:hypothetical protein [Allosphingosinicella sp.]
MQDQRTQAALARIEHALGRIERSVGANTGTADEVVRLREAHALLRRRVEGAIGEIDRLLAEPAEAVR